jgi:hypothetical protein
VVSGVAVNALLGATSTTLYFNDATNIYSVPIKGGSPTIIATANTGIDGAAFDGTSIYWSETNVGIKKTPINGGPTTTIVSKTDAGAVIAMATDGTSLYWIDGDFNSIIKKVSVSGGTPVVLATLVGGSGATSIAVDATAVYWTQSNGSVMKTNK